MLINSYNTKRHNGFTLVEILVVMLILVAMASVTIETTSELAFQNRYEVTKDRYEKIKQAIIGRPDVLINGQPDISGFVADMGRLPFALQELIEEGFCSDTTVFDNGACTGGTPPLVWTANGYGWNGPYISTDKAATDNRAISDGWGTSGEGNYGWDVVFYSDSLATTPTTTIANALTMKIQSLGKDGGAGGADYDADYPLDSAMPSIKLNDWTINLANFSVSVIADSISGSCTPNPIVVNDPVTCELVGGSWGCSTPGYTLQTTCEGAGHTWTSYTSCPGIINPVSKSSCQSVGGTWVYNSNSNICLRLIQNSVSYESGIANSETITEDGREQLLSYAVLFNDADDDDIKDVNEKDYIPTGKVIGILYTDASCSGSNSYPSPNPDKICINTGNHANFTQVHCETDNNGIWIDDGDEQYCDGVVGSACTDPTGTNLGGTAHPRFQVTLLPHTILQTIPW